MRLSVTIMHFDLMQLSTLFQFLIIDISYVNFFSWQINIIVYYVGNIPYISQIHIVALSGYLKARFCYKKYYVFINFFSCFCNVRVYTISVYIKNLHQNYVTFRPINLEKVYVIRGKSTLMECKSVRCKRCALCC